MPTDEGQDTDTDVKYLWEIIVPAVDNDENEFSIEHHKVWDREVQKIIGGLTILKAAKGMWTSPMSGMVFIEAIIPVRIYCTITDVKKVAKFTVNHYDQEAIMLYKVSDTILMIEK